LTRRQYENGSGKT